MNMAMTSAIIPMTPIVTPIPMPAFAPFDRPDELLSLIAAPEVAVGNIGEAVALAKADELEDTAVGLFIPTRAIASTNEVTLMDVVVVPLAFRYVRVWPGVTVDMQPNA